jgi:hypothetical protein
MLPKIPAQGNVDLPQWAIMMFSADPAPFVVSVYYSRKSAREAKSKMAKMKALKIVELYGNVHFYVAK